MDVSPATPFSISVVSNAQGRPPETKYPLAIATVSDEYLVELDEYPADIPFRPMVDGEIPPGTSMVSFLVENLSELENVADFRAAPQVIEAFPYKGKRAAVIEGPAGEWLELVESPGDQE